MTVYVHDGITRLDLGMLYTKRCILVVLALAIASN